MPSPRPPRARPPPPCPPRARPPPPSHCTHIPASLSPAHPLKAPCDESRPELVLRLALGTAIMSVLHIDPLPPADSPHSPLALMASGFFSRLEGMDLEGIGRGDLLQARAIFDSACPHDHLRYTGPCSLFVSRILYLYNALQSEMT